MPTTKVLFTESTEHFRKQTVTIPNLKRVVSVQANTGNASFTVNGNNVEVTVQNGTPVRNEYVSSGYTSYKTASGSSRFPPSSGGCAGSIPYSDSEGYSGTLSLTSCVFDPGRVQEDENYVGSYSGTVSKWIDSSYYRYYYTYEVTITYEELQIPFGTAKVKTAAGTLELVVFDPTQGMDGKNQLRIHTPKGIACFHLVDIADAKASPLRIRTASGIKAISKG